MALDHTVPRLRAKGPADNYHTGLGEGLHPQMKRDFQVSNKQPGYEKQVGALTLLFYRSLAESAVKAAAQRTGAQRHLLHSPSPWACSRGATTIRACPATSRQLPCAIDITAEAVHVRGSTRRARAVHAARRSCAGAPSLNIDRSISKELLRGLRVRVYSSLISATKVDISPARSLLFHSGPLRVPTDGHIHGGHLARTQTGASRGHVTIGLSSLQAARPGLLSTAFRILARFQRHILSHHVRTHSLSVQMEPAFEGYRASRQARPLRIHACGFPRSSYTRSATHRNPGLSSCPGS